MHIAGNKGFLSWLVIGRKAELQAFESSRGRVENQQGSKRALDGVRVKPEKTAVYIMYIMIL